MSQILTEITQQYQQATQGWYQYLFPIAQHLFGMLAVIEIAWSGILWSLQKSELESLWIEFLKKMITIGFCYMLLIEAPVWIPDIIQSFIKIGVGASHINGLYPSSILEQGISVASSIMQPLLKAGLLHAGIGILVGGIASLIVVIAFALIAAELTVSLIESYMVVGSGILLLGFSANRFTSQYASKYLGYSISIGVKLFVLYLVIGVGSTLAQSWGPMIIQGGAKNMTPFFEVIGGALVFLYIVKNIPNKAESLLSGTVSASGGGLIATAVGSAALASRTGTNTVTGGMESIKQAATVSSQHGHSGFGIAKGLATAGANLAVSVLGAHGGHYRNIGSGMQSRARALRHSQAKKQENAAINKK